MNQEVSQKLRDWRTKKAREENVELFRIFQNKTLEDFATILPRNKDELLAIKGIKEKKFHKYGQEILSIVAGCVGDSEIKKDLKVDKTFSLKEKIYSVSDFLDFVNSNLAKIQVGIKGEISSVNFRGHAYFLLKDRDDGSVVNCFMRSSDYQMSGVEIEEGMEVIIRGYPEVYKPSGKLSFQSLSIELVGEGALKKAYDELKKKLLAEGIFDESKKRPTPAFPSKIGLITSKDGAVIHDFQSNLGRFGYKISLFDSRVEGAQAVRDLITAVKYFKDKELDVLVVIRGGGSLESLQAFNNEVLIREIIDYPAPIICGIGHDKDLPLFSLAADKAESTPSFVARELNKSWEQAVEKINLYEISIFGKYETAVANCKNDLNNFSYQFNKFFQDIFQKFEIYGQMIEKMISNIGQTIRYNKTKAESISEAIVNGYKSQLKEISKTIGNFIQKINYNNPARQLKLGYSIIFTGGKVVKSVNQVKKYDRLKSRLGDGEIISSVENIKSKE